MTLKTAMCACVLLSIHSVTWAARCMGGPRLLVDKQQQAKTHACCCCAYYSENALSSGGRLLAS